MKVAANSDDSVERFKDEKKLNPEILFNTKNIQRYLLKGFLSDI